MRSKKAKERKEKVHICTNNHEVDYLAEVIPGKSLWSHFKRGVMSVFIASKKNKRTHAYLRSKDALQQAIQFHLTTNFYMIHPCSTFSFVWEMIIIVVILVSLALLPLWWNWRHTMYKISTQTVQALTAWLLAIDIAIHFFTGRCVRSEHEIEMGRKTVIWKYLRGMFGIDILAAFPVLHFSNALNRVFGVSITRDETNLSPLLYVSIFRLFRFSIYYQNMIEVFEVSPVKQRCFKMVILLLYVIHFTACLQYNLSVWFLRSAGKLVDLRSWAGRLRDKDMNMFSEYIYCLHRVARLLTGVCSKFSGETETEQYLSLFLISIGQVMSFVLIAQAVQILKSRKSSASKFEDMTLQLSQFLRSKNLPIDLQRKAHDYVNFRYHSCFYNEDQIMRTISEQLRQDIILHNCQRLVENVVLFKNMPKALKERIVTRLRSKYYQADDVIIQIDDIGESMYFIKSGTVAVYSKTGKEMCHLEDGDHFGEIALFLDNVKRVANIVAIEDCEIYTLERGEFIIALENYPEIMRSILRTAEDRLKKTRQLEA